MANLLANPYVAAALGFAGGAATGYKDQQDAYRKNKFERAMKEQAHNLDLERIKENDRLARERQESDREWQKDENDRKIKETHKENIRQEGVQREQNTTVNSLRNKIHQLETEAKAAKDLEREAKAAETTKEKNAKAAKDAERDLLQKLENYIDDYIVDGDVKDLHRAANFVTKNPTLRFTELYKNEVGPLLVKRGLVDEPINARASLDPMGNPLDSDMVTAPEFSRAPVRPDYLPDVRDQFQSQPQPQPLEPPVGGDISPVVSSATSGFASPVDTMGTSPADTTASYAEPMPVPITEERDLAQDGSRSSDVVDLSGGDGSAPVGHEDLDVEDVMAIKRYMQMEGILDFGAARRQIEQLMSRPPEDTVRPMGIR